MKSLSFCNDINAGVVITVFLFLFLFSSLQVLFWFHFVSRAYLKLTFLLFNQHRIKFLVPRTVHRMQTEKEIFIVPYMAIALKPRYNDLLEKSLMERRIALSHL